MRDDAVRAHYAGFNVAKAHLARLAEAKFVYVSYRRGNGIFWTAKPTRLAKGEPVVTDGAMMLRARCGNRVSEVPMAPVEAGAPVAPEAMELPAGEAAPLELALPTDVPMVPTPESAMLIPTGGPSAGTSSSAPGMPAGYAPPYFYGAGGSTPEKSSPPTGPSGPTAPGGGSGAPPSGPSGPGGGTPPVTTPESGELAMMVAGISGVVAMANRERKRSA